MNQKSSDKTPDAGEAVRKTRPAATSDEVRMRHQANREGWNQGAEQYASRLDETIEFIRSGNSSLHPVERRNLGDLKCWCKSAIHLQCASGRDTLSLFNEGVQSVVGIDISDRHIENAEILSEATGIPARWFRCDVLDSPVELNESADLVYTGRGSLWWIQDLEAWAAVVFRLLKPGGTFHILDDHPVTYLFDHEQSILTASRLDYFSYNETSRGFAESYLGDLGKPLSQHAPKYGRVWSLSCIFQTLRNAGLQIDILGEHTEEYWNAFPSLNPDERIKIPMTFSLLARKPD